MRFSTLLRRATGIALGTLLGVAPGSASETGTGEVCIAGFKITDPTGPIMDLPGPRPDSKYTFRFDKRIDVSVGRGEMRRVDGLPTDRRFLVEPRLDGRRTEAFWVDFRKEDASRVCLWLYQGYWHWALTYADDTGRGCKCRPVEAG